MRHDFVPYSIAFRRPIVTAAGDWVMRRGAWLRAFSEDGLAGLGEVAPLEPVETAEALAAALERPDYLAAAIDCARLDIEGKRSGSPIAAILGASPRSRILVNALVFSSDIDATVAEAGYATAQGYRSLKLKVAVESPECDIERIRQVRSLVGDEVGLRIDANGAWDEATALRVLRAVEDCHIEYVEDPVGGDTRSVRSRTGIPMAVDARSAGEAWDAVHERRADFLILKPMLLGGLRPASELARAAIEVGIGVVVTSVFETAVGVAGAVHLAASLPGPERAHGLATVALLEDAPVLGLDLPFEGWLRVPEGPGLGVTLKAAMP
jgi:o-succinylbenzoate synthase